MSQPRAADRRKYHRLATDSVVSFADIDRPDQLAVAKDISAGGIRFEAVGCEIELGDTLRVTFNVMKQTIVATGIVVWATDTDPISTGHARAVMGQCEVLQYCFEGFGSTHEYAL